MLSAEQKRYPSEDAETAINEPPRHRNPAYISGNEGERDHTGTGNETEGDHPLVADRIPIRTNEGNRNHQVGERQPICTIRKEWVMLVCNRHRIVDACDPRKQMRKCGDGAQGGSLQNQERPVKFSFRGNAVTPLTARPAITTRIQKRMACKRSDRRTGPLS